MTQTPLRALLVDDNADHRFLTGRALSPMVSAHTLALETAGDGEEAIERLACEPLPALVLLDIKMPRLDGFEVLRRLRAQERTRQVVVVLFTSSENAADVARARALGADGFVTKPLDAREFQRVVRELVERWGVEARRRAHA